MRKLLLISAAISMLPCVVMADDDRWYMAHMGSESCVAISNIGADGDRVYYGAGPMHVPDDIVPFFAGAGIHLHRIPDDKTGFNPPRMVAYSETGKIDHNGINIVLFRGHENCNQAMQSVPK
jgi:hypothetical protein